MKGLKKLIFLVLVSVLFMVMPDNTAKAQDYFTINGKTITVIATEGQNVSKALNEALEEAYELGDSSNIYTVKVPAGKYKLEDIIHIYGNVTLELKGVTLTCSMSKGNMLLLGDSSINTDKSKMLGYGTLHNITINGGTFKGNNNNTSSLVRMAHSKNVTFNGCTFTGGGCAHQVELAAIEGLTIKNCTFKDMKGNGSDEKQEALQLDVPCGEYIFGGTVLDGTPMKDVVITGCTFKNVPRGLGSHSMIVGSYHRNIEITNNKFYDIPEECIVCLEYSDCTITGNEIYDCGAGILVQYFKPYVQSVYKSIYDGKVKVDYPIEHDAKTTISDNTITIVASSKADKSVAIKVYGYNLTKDTKAIGDSNDLIPKNDYYISGVTVSNNTITSVGHGIQFFDTKSSKIENNKITCTGKGEYDGIFLEFASTKNIVTGNKIYNAPRYGICLQSKSNAKKVENNTVSKSGSYGIYLYDGSSVDENIKSNVVSNCKSTAIFLNKKSSVASIISNTITEPQKSGIYVLDNSTVKDVIQANTITSPKDRGISLEKNSTVKSILQNVVSSNGGYGIYLYNAASVTESITDNQISSSGSTAIFLNKSCSAKDILNNTISSPKGKGIYIFTSSKVTNSIKSNKITSGKDRGISVEKSSSVKTISSNTISKSAKYAIYLYNNGKVSGSITGNKISNCKQSAIFLNKKCTAGNITNNTIKSTTGKAIYVNDNSTVKKKINGNTITTATKEGINVCSSKNDLVIEDNVIKSCSSWPVFVNVPSSRTVTIQNNDLTSKKSVTVVQISSGTVKIENNILANGKWAVCMNPGTTGTIGKNTLKKNATNIYMIRGNKDKGAKAKNDGKKATLSSVKSSKKKEITIKWKKVSKSKGYVIQYSTNKDFSDAISVDVKKGTKTTIKGLKSKTTYYVRICSVKNVNGVIVYQPYSKTKTVKVK